MIIKKSQVLFIIFIYLFSLNAYAFFKVIYGEDDRLDPLDELNPMYQNLTLSTAAMVKSYNMSFNADLGVYKIQGRTLESTGVCAIERFSDQITPANCSGFLVGPDLLVTAGHCMRSTYDCSYSSWVFDLKQDNFSVVDKSIYVGKKNVYGCKEIVKSILDNYSKTDFAIIRLDRPVVARVPLKFRDSGKIRDNESLIVIGHPSGLPTKIADGGRVRKNDNEIFFVTTLDAFGGNSGSAVFNANSGVVEGILVRGEKDYEYNLDQRCNVLKRCSEDQCKGEDVTRISVLANDIKNALNTDDGNAKEMIVEKVESGEINLKILDNKTSSVVFSSLKIESIKEIEVEVNITHSYSGDLSIDLVSPNGKSINLRNREGGPRNDVIEVYSSSNKPDLDIFKGESALGEWKVLVSDHVWADRGVVNFINLKIAGR